MIASMIDDHLMVAESKAVSCSATMYQYEIFPHRQYFNYTIVPSLYLKV